MDLSFCLYFKTHFPAEPGFASPVGYLRPLVLEWDILWAILHSCHSTNRVPAVKQAQGTDPSYLPTRLILSSSFNGLFLMERMLFPLNQLASFNTPFGPLLMGFILYVV